MTLFNLEKDFSPHNIAINWPSKLVRTKRTKASCGAELSF